MLADAEADDNEDAGVAGGDVVGDDEGEVDGAGVGDEGDDEDELVLELELDDPTKGPLLQIDCIG